MKQTNSGVKLKSVLALFIILFLIFTLVSCIDTKVKVRTGTRIVCKYGELIKDNTKEIRVPKDQADEYHIVTLRKLCKKHQKLESLQKAANDALKSGNEEGAQEIIEKIVKEEPKLKEEVKKNTGDERAQLDAIKDALIQQQAKSIIELEGKPSSNPTSQQNANIPNPPKTEEPSQPPSNVAQPEIILTSLLPVSISGYTTGSLSFGTNYAVRDFQPEDTREIEFLLITVHLEENEEEAKKFIEKVSKVAFSYDARTVKIDAKSAYFGTDETTYANLSWYDDRIAYEVQMMSAVGKPKALYDHIVNIGELIIQGTQ